MTLTLVDTPDVCVQRVSGAGKHALSLLKHIYVERGTKADWEALAELHYKGHSLAAAPRFYRCVFDDGVDRMLIGVLVFSNPMPLNKGRNEVFPNLKPNQRGGADTRMMNQHRMQQINRFLAWNNRTVLDTMFRSAGIAYRFKNLAYRMHCAEFGLKFIESNSSMGRFNPFSVKAGMRFIKPKPANARDVGVDFFTTHFRAHPCDQVALLQELAAMPEGTRTQIEKKLREFYYRNSAMEKSGDKMHIGMSRVNEKPIDYILNQTIQIVFGATIYWIWGPNPDYGRTLPKRIPLAAFDAQPVMAPLNETLLTELLNVESQPGQ